MASHSSSGYFTQMDTASCLTTLSNLHLPFPYTLDDGNDGACEEEEEKVGGREVGRGPAGGGGERTHFCKSPPPRPRRQKREKSSCMRAPGEWIRPWADATAGGGKRQSHQDGRGGELGGREAPRSAEVPLAARVDLRGERTRCARELLWHRWLHNLNLTPQQ